MLIYFTMIMKYVLLCCPGNYYITLPSSVGQSYAWHSSPEAWGCTEYDSPQQHIWRLMPVMASNQKGDGRRFIVCEKIWPVWRFHFL